MSEHEVLDTRLDTRTNIIHHNAMMPFFCFLIYGRSQDESEFLQLSCCSFQDFVIGLSIILRGTIIDRLNWAFNLYDLNKDGCITKEVRLT